MKYKTIKEATEALVREFNAIPQSMIKKAYCNGDFEGITEITPLSKHDKVYCLSESESGEIVDRQDDKYIVELDNGNEIQTDESDLEANRDGFLPMWGTMWMFGDSCDDWWATEDGGLQLMADCGFRIYETEEGIIFGIDGCGYNFYEAHWIPLCKARGLQWHETETVEKTMKTVGQIRRNGNEKDRNSYKTSKKKIDG